MKLIKKNSNKKGFTLVELVIVIAILAILALILVPAVAKYIGNADTAKNEAAVRTIYTNAVTEFGIEPVPTAATAEKVWETSNLKSGETITVYHDGSIVLGVSYKASATATEYLFYKNEIHSDEGGVNLEDKITEEKAESLKAEKAPEKKE